MDDLEAIKKLKARYFRLMDTKDWDAMRLLFVDDVTVDTTASGGGVHTSADELIAFLREVLGDAVTVHHGHMPEIEITSPTTATGIWALADVVLFGNGTRLTGHGHYHESYVKTGDEWLIATSTLTRLHMDIAGPT
jgi:hypothetical protein